MSTHNADALGSVTVPAALTRRDAIARLLGLAGAGLALAALPGVAHAAPACTSDTVSDVLPPASPPAWPAPSPLASAIIGRLLKDCVRFFDEAKAGVPLDEANARLVERGDAIYGELVDGRGPEARDAWIDALERFDYMFRVLEARAAAGTL